MNNWMFSGGNRCAENADPIPISLPNAKKLSLEPSEKAILEGKYTYKNAEVFLRSKKPQGLMIHVSNTAPTDPKGKSSSSIVCVRNFATDQSDFEYQVPVVGSMVANANGTFSVKIEKVGLKIANGITPKFEAGDTLTSHPSKVVEDAQAKEVYFYQPAENNDKNHEFRYLFETTEYVVNVVVRLERSTDFGQLCLASENPLSTAPKDSLEWSLDPGAKPLLQGIYLYQGYEVFLQANNPKNLGVHFKSVNTSDEVKKWAAAPVCGRNTTGAGALKLELPLVSSLIVDPMGMNSMEIQKTKADLNPDVLVALDGQPTLIPGLPSAVLSQVGAKNSRLIQPNSRDNRRFELRYVLTDAELSAYVLVRLLRLDR